MDLAGFRAQFPVLERVAYLNAGSDGPIARGAVSAAAAALEDEVARGRVPAHFEARRELAGRLRSAYAGLVGCDDGELALTTSTSEGLGAVIAGLDLGPGDEIVASDAEHPGLLGPLIEARSRGVAVRAVPLADVADAVSPATTLVACSHVSWLTGALAPVADLATLDVPVVLDGAQSAGAVPVDVRDLGCAAYAAAGQKWLCGADGTGLLFVAPALLERVRPTRPGYPAFADAGRGLDSVLRSDAAKLDTPALPREGLALSLAAFDLLASVGFEHLFTRARDLAGALAERLAARGRVVAARGATTLVAWEEDDPAAARTRLAAAGVVIRDLPGTRLVRASVGAWNDETDLERLLGALG